VTEENLEGDEENLEGDGELAKRDPLPSSLRMQGPRIGA
jgi:hypothetical protein